MTPRPDHPTRAAQIPGLALLACLALALVPAVPSRADSATDGSALRFDGRDDYVTFDPEGGLALRAFTVETRFKRLGPGRPVGIGSSGIEAIPLISRGSIRDGGKVQGLNYFLGLRAGDGVLVAGFQDQSGRETRMISGTTPPSASGPWTRRLTWRKK